MTVFALCTALGLIISMVVGSMTSMLTGFGVLLVFALMGYLLVISLQERIDEKDLVKMIIRRRFPGVYRVAPKHVRNVWKGFNLPNHNLIDRLS